MEKIPCSGMCHFKDAYDYESFKTKLKNALKNSDIRDVTVNAFNDGSVIVVHEWAETDSDLVFSHACTKKIVEDHGGEYSVGEDQ